MNNNPDDMPHYTETLVLRNLTAVLQAISKEGRTEIFRRLNAGTSSHSPMTSDRILTMVRLLSACGLKFVRDDGRHDGPELGQLAFLLTDEAV